MAGNNSLQILRGDASGVANNSDAILLDGQPFYNKTDNTIVVGDGETKLPDLEPLNSSNAENVTSSIGGKSINSIFEENGTTVKKATSASQDDEGNDIVDTYATKTALSSETSAREAADTALQQNINSEATARENADDTLAQQISTETSNRQSEDNALSQQIEEEVSARTSADSTLTSSINNIINGTTPAQNANQIKSNDGTYKSFSAANITLLWEATDTENGDLMADIDLPSTEITKYGALIVKGVGDEDYPYPEFSGTFHRVCALPFPVGQPSILPSVFTVGLNSGYVYASAPFYVFAKSSKDPDTMTYIGQTVFSLVGFDDSAGAVPGIRYTCNKISNSGDTTTPAITGASRLIYIYGIESSRLDLIDSI